MAEEKIEKGVISEEALEEIAGGFKVAGYDISKETIKKFCNEHKKDLIFTGIEAGTIAIGTIATIDAYCIEEKKSQNKAYQSGYNTAMGKYSRSSNRGVYFDPQFEEKNLPRLFGDEKYEQD